LFLAAVLILIAFDYPVGSYTIGATIVFLIPALIGGWFLARGRVRAIAAEHARSSTATVVSGNTG
jgi:L-asparagine permease